MSQHTPAAPQLSVPPPRTLGSARALRSCRGARGKRPGLSLCLLSRSPPCIAPRPPMLLPALSPPLRACSASPCLLCRPDLCRARPHLDACVDLPHEEEARTEPDRPGPDGERVRREEHVAEVHEPGREPDDVELRRSGRRQAAIIISVTRSLFTLENLHPNQMDQY